MEHPADILAQNLADALIGALDKLAAFFDQQGKPHVLRRARLVVTTALQEAPPLPDPIWPPLLLDHFEIQTGFQQETGTLQIDPLPRTMLATEALRRWMASAPDGKLP